MPDFFPSLASLVPSENIPDNFGSFQNGIDSIFSDLYYKDLQTSLSNDEANAFYSLSVLTYKKLAFEIPGTGGLALVLNPSFTTGGSTEFPISVGYQWQILSYIKGFEVSGFDFSLHSFYELLMDIAGTSNSDILSGTINLFITDSDPIQKFVDDFNANHNPTTPLVKSSDPDETVVINDLLDQLQSNGNNYDVLEIVYDDYLSQADTSDDILSNLETLFSDFLGSFTIDDIKKLLVPQVSASLNSISLALEFPRTILVPLDTNNNVITDENVKSQLTFIAGSLSYTTQNSLDFQTLSDFNFQNSQIGNTGITLSFTDMQLDLSRTTNIPAAAADGRPDDFVGVFVQSADIGLPAFWNHDTNSTAKIIGTDLLIGTGGISGTLGLQAKDGVTDTPILKAKFGAQFELDLDAFDITFQQNAIVASNITGTMKIPGFKDASGNDAVISILVHIDTNGDFSVTATEAAGFAIHIPNIVDVIINSLSIGKQDDKFFVAITGQLDFKDQGGTIGKFIQDPIDIDQLIIWDDGSIELKGFDGTVKLKKPVQLKAGPAKITVTAIHFGTHEQVYNNIMRKYWFFGFDGGVSINPGGVDARGDGIKFYFTVDNDDNAGKPLHVYLRIQSISVDIILPGNASKDNASVLINGYLAMKNPTNPDTTAGTEYDGGITFALPKLKMGGSAAMRLNPSVPAFLVDIDLELPAPIPIGPTGLGIYGFRALLGQRYIASQQAVHDADSSFTVDPTHWYPYYKDKISPDYQEGIQASKFSQEKGFSIGAGASIATAEDAGRTFSSKIFLLLSLPELLMLEGKAAILKKRLGLDTTSDPPFSALLVLTPESIVAGFGVNYKIPESSGFIADIQADMELGFFFHDSSAWYVNIGTEAHPNKAKVLTLFDMYFYFMISSPGIRAGGGVNFHFGANIWIASIDLNAYINSSGRISFHPIQLGGDLYAGGSVKVRLLIFSLGFGASLHLGGESPKPFIVTGAFNVYIKLPHPFKKKSRGITISLTWTFDKRLNYEEVILFEADNGVRALNVMSGETFVLYVDTNSSLPAPAANLDSYIIPVDSYIEIQFTKGMGLGSSSSLTHYGITGGGSNTELIPPQKAVSEQVTHTYTLDDVTIYSWNQGTNSWEEYQPYEALTPLQQQGMDFLNSNTDLSGLSYGYWQAATPGKYNRLRILCTNPLSYMTHPGSSPIPTEQLGFGEGFLFCEWQKRQNHCVDFESGLSLYPEDTACSRQGLVFKVTGSDGEVVKSANSFNLTQGLMIPTGATIEIFFPELTGYVKLDLLTFSPQVQISYQKRVFSHSGRHGVPVFTYNEISGNTYDTASLPGTLEYQSTDTPIDKITIQALGTCSADGFLLCESGDYLLKEDTGFLVLEEADSRQCSTILFEVCWLNLVDYRYNKSLPSQAAVSAQNTLMHSALADTLQPIWRPDTTYLIHVQTTDDAKARKDESYTRYFNIMFRTKGPLGHFHQYRPEYQALVAKDQEDQYKLSKLKFYIDFSRSYPNADGRLTSAKPLFYDNPSLHLFYSYNYVYTMYSSFDAYHGTGAVDSSLQVLIKDPAEPAGSAIAVTPAQVSWVQDPQPKITNDVQVINNLAAGKNCSGMQPVITPASASMVVTPPGDGNLKPDKLYTAIFNASYQTSGDSAPDLDEVHRYVFKTSRYADFTEQVQSCSLMDETGKIELRKAVYDISSDFSGAISEAISILEDTMANDDPVFVQFQDKFDRMLNGVLKINTIDPALTTDFNIIRDTSSGNIIAVLVRNPEPFNDPKTPDTELADTISLTVDTGNAADKVILSKDKSQAFISNATMNLSPGSWLFTFKYKLFNGSAYAQVGPDETVTLPIS